MSVDQRDLKIAEMIKRGSTYKDIQDTMKESGTPVSNDKIVELKKMIAEGVITFSEEGVARETEPKLVMDIHKEIMGVVTKEAAEEAVRYAEEDYKLGRELRQFWFLKAQEKGMALREFVKAALIFYDDYKDLANENEELRKISRDALQALSVNTVTRKRLDLYYKFCSDMIKLRAQGLEVPQQVIVDFYSDLEYLSKGGTIPLREVISSGN
jgi:hypothetical protein